MTPRFTNPAGLHQDMQAINGDAQMSGYIYLYSVFNIDFEIPNNKTFCSTFETKSANT
jgi:hypothetical protein